MIITLFMRKVARKQLSVKFVPSDDQLADILTKALPSPRFLNLIVKLTVVPIPCALAGMLYHIFIYCFMYFSLEYLCCLLCIFSVFLSLITITFQPLLVWYMVLFLLYISQCKHCTIYNKFFSFSTFTFLLLLVVRIFFIINRSASIDKHNEL